MVAGVADGAVEREQVLDAIGDVSGAQNVSGGETGGRCVDEVDARVVAGDVNVTIGVSGQAAGQGRETREALGERGFEEGDERVLEGERRKREEEALLDVVAGEHGEVGDGELEVTECGGLVGEDGGLGHHLSLS